jgi:hypothetical protein
MDVTVSSVNAEQVRKLRLYLDSREPGDIGQSELLEHISLLVNAVENGNTETRSAAKDLVLKGIVSDNLLMRGICMGVVKDVNENRTSDTRKFVDDAYGALRKAYYDSVSRTTRLEIYYKAMSTFLKKI